MSPGSGAAARPSPINRISSAVEYCIVPTNTGRPPAPLRDQGAVISRIDTVRPVICLGNDRRESRPREAEIHFIADLLQAGLNDAESNGIEAHHLLPHCDQNITVIVRDGAVLRFNQDCGVHLLEDRRTGNMRVQRQLLARIDRCVLPA